VAQTTNRNRSEGRRQRRIERRRRRILEAAARVFARKSYAQTTTKEIADEADVAEGTLYNYFGGKREILLAIASETQSVIDAVLGEVSTIQSREDMVALAEKGLQVFISELPFTRTLFAEVWVDDVILQEFFIDRFQRIWQQLQRFITERIEAGIFRPVDPVLTSSMVMGIFVIPIIPVLRGVNSPPTLEERCAWAEAAVDLIWDGVRVRKD
jgi:AcrR family transcriptional regulator